MYTFNISSPTHSSYNTVPCKETFPPYPTAAIKIPLAQEKTDEKNDVWNQNVLQKIVIWKHDKIAIRKQVWTPR